MAQSMALDEENIRALPLEDRIHTLEYIFKNSDDESKRWDAVWLLGEVAEELTDNNPLLQNVSDLCAYVLRYDDNSIVRHEVCYQIAGRNMRDKIPDLVWSALNDPSDLVRHEATECLGIIHAHEEIGTVIKATKDPSKNVRDTAEFVLKRMERSKGKPFDPTTTSF